MNHLTPRELLDLAEGNVATAQAAHVETCDRCRASVADLRSTITTVREVQVPEPLSEFWNAFSIRVRRAIDAKTSTGPQARVVA